MIDCYRACCRRRDKWAAPSEVAAMEAGGEGIDTGADAEKGPTGRV
jgi:hypothetical protein